MDFLFEIRVLILPLAVQVLTLFLNAPYSTGNLNCFSLTKLCDDVVTTTLLSLTKLLAIINPSTNVAHAE